MTTTYHEHINNGRIMDAFLQAIVYGALWSIGSAWSIAIREITRILVPDDTFDTILAELGAALLTTVLGVSVSVAIAHCSRSKTPPPPTAAPRLQSLPTRRG